MKTSVEKNIVLVVLLMSAVFLTGCASVSHPEDPLQACLATCQRLNLPPTHYILTVNISRQEVQLFEQTRLVKTCRCSTSRFGVGEALNSDQTPLGLHRIAEKIGDGEMPGTPFRDRKVVSQISQPGVKRGGIRTRILWLEGLEPGYNQGGSVDTHDRLIYIHGTGDQRSFGKPSTDGCIHMADADLISLFDLLPSGTLVWLAEK